MFLAGYSVGGLCVFRTAPIIASGICKEADTSIRAEIRLLPFYLPLLNANYWRDAYQMFPEGIGMSQAQGLFLPHHPSSDTFLVS